MAMVWGTSSQAAMAAYDAGVDHVLAATAGGDEPLVTDKCADGRGGAVVAA